MTQSEAVLVVPHRFGEELGYDKYGGRFMFRHKGLGDE